MAQGKPQMKFQSNPGSNFRDNRCHGRTTYDVRQTTDDGRRTNFDIMSSADIVKQS